MNKPSDLDIEVAEQVAEYQRTSSSKTAERILSLCMPSVKYIADTMAYALPKDIEAILGADDLLQIGCMAVFQSLKSYDSSKGAKFWTFAQPRVKGSMQDALRRMSSNSRTRSVQFISMDEMLTETSWDLATLLDPSVSDTAHEAILKLAEPDQSILLLLINGFNVRTIARLLDYKLADIRVTRDRVVMQYLEYLRSELNVDHE